MSASLAAGAALLVVPPIAAQPADGLGTPAKGPVIHTIGGCEIFPADNPWNTPVDGRPVAGNSDTIIKRQAKGSAIHLDLGTTESFYGIPVDRREADQSLLPLRFGVEGENYGDESDNGPVPIPQDGAHRGLAQVPAQPARR